jgi:DNA-binding GntR family transcriptional regulator
MQKIEPLRRLNISETVADAVRAMIVDGRLAPGERINEVRLSGALGVSRTPLREALNRLASEGALSSTPAIGYSVRPLTVEEFEQLYAIRPLLDPEALRLAGLPSPARLARLEALNRRFGEARDAEAAIALDDDWHRELIAACPNKVLLELIDAMILRTRRYEVALMRETPNRQVASEDHARIMEALRHGDLPAACEGLKHNMETGFQPVLTWLAARAAAEAAA